jgi:hypothetical protein
VRESGKPLAQIPELRVARWNDGTVVLEAGSGQYRFTSKLRR